MQVKIDDPLKSSIKGLGFDRTIFMMQFIKGSWIAYICGVVLFSGYKLVENVVMGQLYAATASIDFEKAFQQSLLLLLKLLSVLPSW